MVLQLRAVQFNTFLISAIQLIVCSAIHLLKIRRLSITGRAQRIVLNSNISQHIFNSQVSFVTRTELTTSAVLGIESAWLIDAMVFSLVRPAWARLIAILTSIVMFSSRGPAKQPHSQVICAIHLICAIWVVDADSTLVRQPAENAWNIFLYQQVLVIIFAFLNSYLAIYANSPQDLLMCSDGFGALDIPIPGVVDVRNF